MQQTTTITHKLSGMDGFRFIAFIAILLCHTFPQANSTNAEGYNFFLDVIQLNGVISLQFFFFLSAFLLTYLEIKKEKKSIFNVKQFFKKRALRILPLYVFIMLIAFVLLPFIARIFNLEINLPNVLPFLTFTSNFYFDASLENQFTLIFLVITWSIAVEVQFYLLLAVILRFLKEKVVFIGILFVLIGISFNFYAFLLGKGHYFHLLTYFADFGAGMMTAFIFQARNTQQNKSIDKLPNWIYYLFLFFCFLILTLWNTLFKDSNLLILNSLLFPFIFCMILLHQLNPNKKHFKIASFPLFEKLGELSYGLYLYHGLVITALFFILEKTRISYLAGAGNYFAPLLVLILSTAISMLSYRYLELPFLRMKPKNDSLSKEKSSFRK